jgi:hypothetical protein
MGCWNETCGITQMPIEGGDPVRLFLLVESEHYHSESGIMHYSTDLWKPFGLPLKGTYDEYGRIENIEQDVLSDILLESLKEMIVEVPTRMGDVFKREELNWETAIEFLTDEGLKVTDPFHYSHITKRLNAILAKFKAEFPDLPDNGWSSERSKLADEQKKEVEEDPSVVRVYHMMVHEEVYQSFMKYKVPAERFSSWTGGNLREVLLADAQKYVSQIREELKETAGMSELDKFKHDGFTKSMRRFDTQNRFVSLTNHLNGNYGSGSHLGKYLDFIEKRVEAGAGDDDPQIKLLTDQFIQFAMFSQSMTLLRKLWMPQTGKGGQDREYALYKYLGQVITDFSDKKIKAWEAEYGEEEDAEESQQVPTEET